MSAVLHRDLTITPRIAHQGDGLYVVDQDGRRYLDASGGAAVSCLGHSHPAIIAAVQAQVAALPYAHSGFFTNAPAEALAAHLIARAPTGFGAGRVAFLGSGSEAMEAALKLARQYHVETGAPERTRFIARRMSYHGNTLGALAISGNIARRAIYTPMLMEVTHISPCNPYRDQRDDESPAAYATRIADELETAIIRAGPGTVAAFIAETVAGATLGAVPPIPGYFARIRDICDRHGVLFIADEVMCGMGRTGHLFAIAPEKICPDIITIAKGLGAGYQPIAATLAAERVIRPIETGSGALANGHTYMGHPVACAAALAVLQTIEQQGLLENVRTRGAELRAALDRRFGQHPHVGDIRGVGLFQALELVADRTTKTPFPRTTRMAETIKRTALEHGLMIYPSAGTAGGAAGDHILLAPPYTITSADIAILVDRLAASLDEVLARAA